MRRISRKQRCTPAILSWQGILESGKYQGNGEQDRRPRTQQNPRSRRRRPRDQRKLVRCCDERRPDLAIVLLSNVPSLLPCRFLPSYEPTVHDLVADGLSSTSHVRGWKCVTNATAQSLQARWFIPLEMRVISGKKEALQAFSISKNVAWNTLTFRFEVT